MAEESKGQWYFCIKEDDNGIDERILMKHAELIDLNAWQPITDLSSELLTFYIMRGEKGIHKESTFSEEQEHPLHALRYELRRRQQAIAGLSGEEESAPIKDFLDKRHRGLIIP